MGYMNEMNLVELRKQIDEVDQQLLSALQRRMELVQQVGMFKKQNNLPPLDQKRWQEVLDAKKEFAKEKGLSESLVYDIYQRIHSAALEIEEKISL
jgi:chorismate mutase